VPDEDLPLAWKSLARVDGGNYRIFRTAFLDAAHPRTHATKRFSLILTGDWVNVIALTPAREVVLIRQWRAGTDAVTLEIPGGMIDPGEDPRTAVARELAEETGYTARTWHALGVIAPNPAILGNHLHCFLALDAALTEPLRPDGSEVLAQLTAPLADALAMVRDGRIDHALVVAAFGLFALSPHA
jgi:8-oxo-dGTP pyrophosphatase MutT (NUDIX family)